MQLELSCNVIPEIVKNVITIIHNMCKVTISKIRFITEVNVISQIINSQVGIYGQRLMKS